METLAIIFLCAPLHLMHKINYFVLKKRKNCIWSTAIVQTSQLPSDQSHAGVPDMPHYSRLQCENAFLEPATMKFAQLQCSVYRHCSYSGLVAVILASDTRKKAQLHYELSMIMSCAKCLKLAQRSVQQFDQILSMAQHQCQLSTQLSISQTLIEYNNYIHKLLPKLETKITSNLHKLI